MANPAPILNSFGMTFKNVLNDYRRAEECYRKTLELDPLFASCYNNYALLFTSIKKDDNKADRHYLKALELNSTDPVLLGNYAFFLQNARRKFSESEVCYQEAIRINNSEPSNLANFASLKLIMGDIEVAKQLASKSLLLCIPSPDRFTARPLFVLIIIRMFECKDYRDLIGNMKFLFSYGMDHVPWDNRELMEFAKKVLNDYEYQLLQKIFNTINDYSCMEDLIKVLKWNEIDAQPFVNKYFKQ
jgi:tetratricopeptide (TPR) repeat protein